MESSEVLDTVTISDNSVSLCGDGLKQMGNGVKGSGNSLGVNLLEDLDSYWEDINDRLIISRMVSDSVMKGIINAVEQEAADKIVTKELEMAILKESLQDVDNVKMKPENINYEQFLSFSHVCVEHDKMRESLGSLRNTAVDQFKSLKQKENQNGLCVDGFDRTVLSLEKTVDAICTSVDEMLHLSTSSVCDWQHEQEFQRGLEDMVMQSSIRGLQEEFKQNWGQNSCFCDNPSVKWLEKVNEISGLHKELDAILKLLPNSETGQLISHGSLSIHVPFSPSLWERNGKLEESKTAMPESSDSNQFKNMSEKDLVKFLSATITEMKRDHEATVQRMTEEYFSLRGKYLSERGSLTLKKDKEFDALRKKIPEVLVKLDGILGESDKFLGSSNSAESLGSMKNRLDSLLFENRKLQDLLTDKKNGVKCLSSQVSEAEANLNLSMEDAGIEASVREEVYTCVLRELSHQIKSDREESEFEFTIMQEIYKIIFGKASQDTESTSKCEIDESDIESLIMQGMCGIIFEATIKDAEGQLNELYKEYLIVNESRVSLETVVLEKENQLVLTVAEKERLKEEKEKLASEVSVKLVKEKEQLELASQELNKLRDHTNWQEKLISESRKDLDIANGKLVEAAEQIEVDKMEINSLNQKILLAMKELKEADEQKKMVLALAKQKQYNLSQFEAQEKEHMKQMEAVIALVAGLSEKLANFEYRVAEDIKNNNLRLQDSSSQLVTIIKEVNTVTRTRLLYRQKLERKCSDLQMAEAEVDLLGDEVETLSSLLEKIYIALDHYSPILQHYPGIIEILKLIGRELSAEPTKRL